MSRKKITALLLSSSLASFSLSAPTLAEPVQSTKKWGAHIEAEGKYGTERSLGELGAFIPLWQDDNTLIFTDIRGRLDSQDSEEGNFGIGVRHQINQDWIVGGYGFYDRRKTGNDNYYHQATIGAEVLSENLEFRVNGYLPERGAQEISGTGGGTSSSATINGGNFQITTTTSGSLREKALPGFDVEAGYKFDLPDNWDIWAYGGGFHFDADGVDKVSGPRGRVELNYNNVPYLGEGSRFTVGFESQRDSMRGGQSWGIARLRVPLNFGRKSETQRTQLSALDRRMTTRIVRDVDIVSGEETAQASTITTENATATLASGTQVTTFTTIDAADNITAAVAAAGVNALILIDGSAGTVNTATTIQTANGQTLVGGGTQLTVTGNGSGTQATLTLPGTRPTINGTSTGGGGNDVFFINDDDVVIQNMAIQGGQSVIRIDGANDLIFRNTDISTPSATFVAVSTENTNNLDFIDTNFSNVSFAAYQEGSTSSNISFTNVTVDTGTRVVYVGGGNTLNTISGSITATNISGTICSNAGTINGSTLLINGVLCN